MPIATRKFMKRAFTTIELIFVIVVIGILAAVIIPRFHSDRLRNAANHILTYIRYTQHLAMIDDRFQPNKDGWYKERWRISFRDCNGASTQKYFVIYRDLNHGGAASAPGKDESAINELDKKYLYNDGSCDVQSDESEAVLIGKKFGINALHFHGGCRNQYIGFDEIGRPYNDLYHHEYSPIRSDCLITFSNDEGSFTITITKETGYSYISSITP